MKYAEQILNNESARCMLCSEAPCTAACPEGFDPARFVRAARFENAAVGAGYVRQVCGMLRRMRERLPALRVSGEDTRDDKGGSGAGEG